MNIYYSSNLYSISKHFTHSGLRLSIIISVLPINFQLFPFFSYKNIIPSVLEKVSRFGRFLHLKVIQSYCDKYYPLNRFSVAAKTASSIFFPYPEATPLPTE